MNDKAQMKFDAKYRPRVRDMSALIHSPAEPVFDTFAARKPKTTEAKQFANRNGYGADFLGPFAVPLPTPIDAKKGDVRKVKGGSDGRLDYQNFSVVMSVSRRMAMFVAVNIEGSRPVDVKRDNDRWSLDGRIPAEAQLGEELYLENNIDRGHLACPLKSSPP